MKVTPEDFNYSKEKIAEMKSWPEFNGFAGETCGGCKKTTNVLNGPGWICVCGYFNVQSFHGGSISHETPDLGPPLQIIREVLASVQEEKP